MHTKRDCEGMTILEVGSGRGGGVYYMSKYLNAKKVVGVDYSRAQINFCKVLYSDLKDV